VAARKVLITGATGQTFRPVAEALAEENEVWCLARFSEPAQREAFEAQGITTHVWNMGVDDLDGVPRDFTHVLHAATLRFSDDPDEVLSVNSVGTGMLMEHCRSAEAFLAVSTFGVYRFVAADHRYAETDPVSGHTPSLPSYATTKLVEEGVVRAYARTLGLRATIARLNTGYGPLGRGGMPVRFFRMMLDDEPIVIPADGHDEWHNMIHTDDLIRQVPKLWGIADVVPPVVNWAGDETISIREMMAHISEITGVPVRYEPREVTLAPKASDNTRRRSLIGPCQVTWHDGVARAIEAHFPGAVKAPGHQERGARHDGNA
jgi:nucleoside-diphosphate-sugar epimerase